MLLHKSSAQSCGTAQHLQCTELDDLQSARSLVQKVLADSLMKLQGEETKQRKSIRWELGACWVQHLQNQASGKVESKKSEDSKVEQTVKGLGKQFGQLKEIKKKIDEKGCKIDLAKENSAYSGVDANKTQVAGSANSKEKQEIALQKLLPEAAFLRLKESDTGLHLKVYPAPVINRNSACTETALNWLSKSSDPITDCFFSCLYASFHIHKLIFVCLILSDVIVLNHTVTVAHFDNHLSEMLSLRVWHAIKSIYEFWLLLII